MPSLCLALTFLPFLWGAVGDDPETQLWFSHCRKCDLESMKLFGTNIINLKGSEDESCLTYCIGSESAGHYDKRQTIKWLLSQGVTIDNDTFSMVCTESRRNKKHDLKWEQFPLRLLEELEKTEGHGYFDYGEALCHAAYNGCVQTVRKLLKKTKTANFDKIIGNSRLGGDHYYAPTTPLIEAVFGNQIEVIEVLIGESDATFDHHAGTCLVSLALQSHNYEVAKFLVKMGAPLNPGLLNSDMPEWQHQLLLDAQLYRKKLCETVESYLIFYAGDVRTGERPETIDEDTVRFVMAQLSRSTYSPLEVRSCITPN